MVSITSERFTLKELTPTDASERYLSWFNDTTTQQFIATRAESLAQLKNYIEEKSNRTDCLFFGIYCQDKHIGNIKYEPIDLELKQATMGILIGERLWRGKGVAGEVISATTKYLQQHLGIEQILLGVEQDNTPAIHAYEKLGFEHYKETQDGLYMRLNLSK